jgi:hypothetical protein
MDSDGPVSVDGDAIMLLEVAAGVDGYVVSKHPYGYTVRLRGAIGSGTALSMAIRMAILADHKQTEELKELDKDEMEEAEAARRKD